jgi:hypothetical protein
MIGGKIVLTPFSLPRRGRERMPGGRGVKRFINGSIYLAGVTGFWW